MIIAYAKSDIGKAREMNQDAYYISDSSSEIKLYLLYIMKFEISSAKKHSQIFSMICQSVFSACESA